MFLPQNPMKVVDFSRKSNQFFISQIFPQNTDFFFGAPLEFLYLSLLLNNFQDSTGGMQYLLACVRSNTGIKSGRYIFEVRILETIHPFEQNASRHRWNFPVVLLFCRFFFFGGGWYRMVSGHLNPKSSGGEFSMGFL